MWYKGKEVEVVKRNGKLFLDLVGVKVTGDYPGKNKRVKVEYFRGPAPKKVNSESPLLKEMSDNLVHYLDIESDKSGGTFLEYFKISRVWRKRI